MNPAPHNLSFFKEPQPLPHHAALSVSHSLPFADPAEAPAKQSLLSLPAPLDSISKSKGTRLQQMLPMPRTAGAERRPKRTSARTRRQYTTPEPTEEESRKRPALRCANGRRASSRER